MFRGLFGTRQKYNKLTTNENDHYENGYSDSEDSDAESPEEANGILLKRLASQPTTVTEDNVEYYEIPVDLNAYQNLHSVALRYNCSVWELKRCNNFHTAQDYFACRSLRIPALKNSYRAELLKSDGGRICHHPHEVTEEAEPKEAHVSIPVEDVLQCSITGKSPNEDGCSQDPGSPSVRTISIRDHIRGTSDDHLSGTHFLRALDRDLQRIRQSVTPIKASMNHAVDSLLAPRILPLVAIPCPSISQTNTSHQSASSLATSPSVTRDFYCGLSYHWLMVGLLCLLVLLPLGYVLLIYPRRGYSR